MSVATPMAALAGKSSDSRIMGVVGSAHFISHVLQLALAPLFPIMHAELGVSFVELGLVLTLFYASSGLGQMIAGVLVDRFGAHRLLLAGVALQSAAVGAMGFVPGYPWLLPLAVLAGLGNSVYHPADLSILSHRVSAPRLGRAFATHVLAGAIGFGLSPLLVGTVAALAGWRMALFAAGALGLAVTAFLLLNRDVLVTQGSHPLRAKDGGAARAGAAPGFLKIATTPVVVLAFFYFVLTSFAIGGIQSFAISALTQGYGAVLASATLSVALYQVGTGLGVMAGGVLADRARHHHRVAMAGLAVAAVMTALVFDRALPFVVLIGLIAAAGFATGITMPSRDVLVRRGAPAAGLGKVFGFVYSGFDVGALIGPLVYGALLDNHQPSVVFLVSAAALGLAIVTVLGVGRRHGDRAPASPARAAAA